MIGGVHATIPETGSEPVNVTVTGCVYQPLLAGGPDMFALTTGPLVSILTTTLVEVLSPTPLVAAQVRVVPTVSAVSVVPSQPVDEVIGDSGSATVQLTTTWLVYQPFWPAVPSPGDQRERDPAPPPHA